VGAECRWERLEQLLTEATGSSDYDVTLAIDQLLDYILSDQGTQPHSFAKQRTFSTFSRALVGFIVLLPAHLPITFSVPPPVSPLAGEEFRLIFASELVNSIDRLGVDTTNYVVKNWRTIASSATVAGGAGPTLGTQGTQHFRRGGGWWCVRC
jgi:hypothetical protein